MTQTHSGAAQEPPTTEHGPTGTTTQDGGTPAVRSTTAFVLILVALLWPLEVLSLSYSLLTPAVTQIAVHYQTDQVGWVFTSLTLVGGVAGPVMSKFGDLYGKKKVMVVGALGAVVGGFIAALAPNFPTLLAGRALQGLMLPLATLSYSLMRDILPQRWIAFAASLTVGGTGVVTISAPFIAGYFVDHHGFRSVFWLLAILSVIAFLGLLAVPESTVRSRSRLDWTGVALLGAGVGLVLLGLSEAATWTWSSPKTLGCLIGGLVLLLVWVAVERRIREPLVDLRLVSKRPVLTTIVVAGLAYGAVGAYTTILPMMAMTPRALGGDYGFGSTAMQLTLFTVPAGIATCVPSFIVGLRMRRIGARFPAVAGSLIMALAAAYTAFWHTEKWQVLVGFTVLAAGASLAFAAVPNLVIEAAPVEQQAITAGMTGLLQTLGSTAAVQIVYVILLQNVGQLVRGSPVFTGAGYTVAFLACASFALVATVVGVLVPHGRPQPEPVDS
ncbi:MFS family permease [Streptomyces sp. SAI-135]|jgi:MFS family permease|uniref:MFS transporter n=1 Tax=unclassified Streptomyces TaxID=2593676 RepID=UPI002474BB70|nr:MULTISPECIES: MFS transporter [unclassified Streptomyces]MDH6521938.1 MFS family permease [Streptomyces sp. SAI-090]MDH6573307.1 MFS family permease [Streptomyces sp. SAI-117]MDH6613960.1 MFS family permease [Streptomyces sp. SAI-135]